MKFLNTATHPGTLFSRMGRRGSREDELVPEKHIDELTPLGPRPQTAPGTQNEVDIKRRNESSAHKVTNGELTGIIGVHIPSTPTFTNYQYLDLIPVMETNGAQSHLASREMRRNKSGQDPHGARQAQLQYASREVKPPTPPKTPTETFKTTIFPAPPKTTPFIPPRKASGNELTALPTVPDTPADEGYGSFSAPDLSPKSKERLFLVPDDDLMQQTPKEEPEAVETAGPISPTTFHNSSAPSVSLIRRPTIKSQKSSMSLKLGASPPCPPPKGPLPDIPPVARERELMETNRQLRQQIELLLEQLRITVQSQQQPQ